MSNSRFTNDWQLLSKEEIVRKEIEDRLKKEFKKTCGFNPNLFFNPKSSEAVQARKEKEEAVVDKVNNGIPIENEPYFSINNLDL